VEGEARLAPVMMASGSRSGIGVGTSERWGGGSKQNGWPGEDKGKRENT
jgi:hypothetical protein